MKFYDKKSIRLNKGQYLTNATNEPIYNAEFVNAQQLAHTLVTMASEIKETTFKSDEGDTLNDVIERVTEKLASTEKVEYLKQETPPQPITNSLAEEAYAWMKATAENTNVDITNAFLQNFNVLKDFEAFGLYFEEKLVKLEKIYTMKEIIAAAQVCTPHSDALSIL